MYAAPKIEAAAGAARALRDLPGRVLVATMQKPWALLQECLRWQPAHVHFVTDMDLDTLEALERRLPSCDVVVGVGGGSSCDTAKYLAWKRGCRMVLVPAIISVDAPLTNMVGVRVDKKVQYVGDIYPQELIIDYTLIQSAPAELNRAGAGDIASIHTALWDWKRAHADTGEAYDAGVAEEARQCLEELDRNAAEIYRVSPKGIDTVVDLYRREVAFCARIDTSRPEEGSEHIVAYNLEHITRRHFVHGDLVALGIFAMSRLQENEAQWAADLLRRCGLRYRVPNTTMDEVRACLRSLKQFKEEAELFYSVLDVRAVSDDFIEETLAAIYSDD